MRFALVLCVLLSACSGLGTTADVQRRGAVELVVKSDFAGVQRDIRAGGGPVLTAAMDAARIPASDRPARVVQLQRDLPLYGESPGALVLALTTYGG